MHDNHSHCHDSAHIHHNVRVQEYTNLEGKKDTIKMNWEGNALVATVTAERGEAITKRTIQDGKMILATTSKGVTMKRIFKRLE